MKRIVISLSVLVALLVMPVCGMAKEIKVEGSIQGLMCTTKGMVCPVGEEDVIAAIESTFVVVDKDGNWYLMPNIDPVQAAKALNMTVRLEGEKVLGGRGINVTRAELLEDGEWKVIYDAEIAAKMEERQRNLRNVGKMKTGMSKK